MISSKFSSSLLTKFLGCAAEHVHKLLHVLVCLTIGNFWLIIQHGINPLSSRNAQRSGVSEVEIARGLPPFLGIIFRFFPSSVGFFTLWVRRGFISQRSFGNFRLVVRDHLVQSYDIWSRVLQLFDDLFAFSEEFLFDANFVRSHGGE